MKPGSRGPRIPRKEWLGRADRQRSYPEPTPVPHMAPDHMDGTEPWTCEAPEGLHPRCEDVRRRSIGLLSKEEREFERRGVRFFQRHTKPLTERQKAAAKRLESSTNPIIQKLLGQM